MQARIAVTGMGIVSAAGWSVAQTLSALTAERSGLGALSLFDSPCCGHVPVGQVRDEPAMSAPLRRRSRGVRFAVHAAEQAFRDAGLEPLPAEARGEIGVVMGACTGGMLQTELFVEKMLCQAQLDVRLLRDHSCGTAAEAIGESLHLAALRCTVSDACASGATAIAMACDMLLSGEAQAVLAGGVDTLTRLTLNGFCSLLVVAPDGCRPFDADRAGMSLGEGCGMLVLETEQAALARGARPHGYIAGWAGTCDAYHPTAPRPDGSGAARAMTQALRAAGMTPAEVDYVNAHGSGTIDNDQAEARAIATVFGERLPMVSSTKRFFGHTLAAAGAIEAIVCLLAIEHGIVPANLGLRRADPQLGLVPVSSTRQAPVKVAMSNSLGFGGSNCSLVMCRSDARAGGEP